MGSRTGGTVATMVISVPIAAVLLMAMFGVPRIAPGVNGKQETVWQDPREFLGELQGKTSQTGMFEGDSSYRPGGENRNPFYRQEDNAPLAPGSDDAPGWGSPRSSETSHGPSSRTQDPTGANYQYPERNQYTERNNRPGSPWPTPNENRFSPNPDNSRSGGSPNIGWQEASRKLNELGIEHYRIEAGSTLGSFVFICQFSPGDDPQVIQRFEAERNDPLQAVAEAIRQIEDFLRDRHQGSNNNGFPFR
ncbi:MAG: hypothetical protein R3C01_15300 [Planctomycetaceae bacterium]